MKIAVLSLKSRKNCHPDWFMYPINHKSILILEFAEDKRIKNKSVHWAEGIENTLVQLENQNYVTFNDKNSYPVYNYMYSFPDLITKPICNYGN